MNLKNCPICTTKLKNQNGRLTCPSCGYHVSSGNESPKAGAVSSYTTQTTKPVSASIPSPKPRPTFDTQSDTHTSPPVVYVSSSAAKKKSHIGLAALIGVILVSFFILLSVAYYIIGEMDDNFSSASSYVSEALNEDEFFDSDLTYPLPESEFFQELVSQIFEKKFDEITEEDIARITQLHFYYDADDRECVYAFLDDGSVYNYFVNNELYADYADLSCFTNMELLTLEYGYPSTYDLEGLTNLTGIASDMSLTDLAEALPCPEKLTTVEIYSTIFVSSLEGIETFPNLTSLTVDSSSLEDISQLSSAPQLEQLNLTNCDWLEDFSPLYELTNLATLTIDSSALKDIGFVKEMPNLSYLCIRNAELLKSIDALSERADTMHYLYLEDTWELADYSVLETLTNLEELQFYVSSYQDSALPSFEAMENLTYLNIYGAGDLSALSGAKNLLYLTLDSCNCENLSFLSNMESLLSLELTYMSGYFVDLEPIKALPKLQRLIINDSTAYANVESLLGIPTLTEFYMNGCEIGFRPDLVPYNENLMILDMSDVTLYPIENPNDYGWLEDSEELLLSEHTEIFANFPHLCELYLAQNDLDDISFISEIGLHDLQVLDITDNYITDLSPLSELEYLHTIKGAGNPFANTTDFDSILLR